VYSSVIRVFAWPAILLASMLDPPPRDIGAAHRVLAKAGEIQPFFACRTFQSLPQS
jgi:hypothetical protein